MHDTCVHIIMDFAPPRLLILEQLLFHCIHTICGCYFRVAIIRVDTYGIIGIIIVISVSVLASSPFCSESDLGPCIKGVLHHTTC